ncbi:hypothetical protein BGZ57DRAFT_972847 [Hyaloscypha finlandica]|nr:hypothetical protein BGZ57DRAFT_972847 [Hyaloscypha finlandica]
MDTYLFVKDLGSTPLADVPIARYSPPMAAESLISSHGLQPPDATITSTFPAITSISSSTPIPANASVRSERPLILYAYFETEEARFNLEFFIKHALHAQADFVFILSGENEAEKIIPDDLHKRYKKFILLNAKACWSDLYLNKITDEVELVGMTANCWPQIHVQSMILATDDIGMEVLLFPPPEAHKIHAVRAEVGSSVLMTTVGHKLDAMMAAYHTGYFEQCDSGAEFLNENTYFGISYHPYETLFFKTNRPINEKVIDRYTEWTGARNYSSYDFCKAPV